MAIDKNKDNNNNTDKKTIDNPPKKNNHTAKKKIIRKKIIKKAILDIYVIPFGDIYIDDKKISSVTRLGYKIRAGKHKLEIKNTDGEVKFTKIINLKPGEKKEFRFNLN